MLRNLFLSKSYKPTNALLYTIIYYSKMSVLKKFKNAPTCFDRHSDHLQGARRFLVKVTEFKIFYKFCRIVKVICGDVAA